MITMKAIDFFCGAGGLTKGLQQAGIDVIAGIDLNKTCQPTYDVNNAPAKFVGADINNIQREDLKALIPDLMENRDNILFAGCAPCQSFSQQRRSNKKRPDATVLGEFGRLVEEVLPGSVLVENVPGIAKIKGRSTFKRFLEVLDRNGYSYVWDTLNAKDYGVPQNRVRMVLIAVRNGRASLPEKTHGEGLLPYNTVRDTIEKFPPLQAGESHPDILNHTAASIMQINMARLMATPHDGGDRQAWPNHLVLECHKNGHKGHGDVYGRMFWDLPAPTLTGKCYSFSNGRYGHPEQDRAISLREAASLQTFPDDYEFYGNQGQKGLQIGNAVPVLLGEVLGRHILSITN